MKLDKLSVVVGGALLIFVAAFIILQYVKSMPANRTSSLVPTSQSQIPTPTGKQTLPSTQRSANPSTNISVNSPKSNQTVSVPFVVSGSARVFENTINYRLLDSSGNEELEGSAIANTADSGQFDSFSFTISGVNTKGKASLQVFDYSAKDGSEIDKVTIPLVLK